jgi:alpha-glucosidase
MHTITSPHGAGRRVATAEWWREAVLYHVYLPSFRDSNGDGTGDLDGLIDALPYLTDTLGIDAIWVSPFFASPWLDGGYDIADHTAVDPRFGDLEAVDRLIAAAHSRAVRVIVDYVPNHTSDRHPWFVESRSSRENPKHDWYVWADARPGEALPNNWVSEAGGSVWEWDATREQFYMHSHLVEQPDLNWRHPEVRAAMLDVLRFWLDRGIDGFRIDVAHMLMKDPELRDNPPNPDATPNPYDRQHPDFTTQLHVNDRRHPDLHGVLRDIRAVLDRYGDRVAIGELDVMPWAEWASYYGADLDELHLPLNFRLIETPWTATAVASALDELERALPGGAWAINNLGNHDRSRIASRYGEAAARGAALLLMTAPGTPLLYYGDELGMTDVSIPADRLRDGFARTEGGPTRDPNRTPLPWSAAPGAGFSSAESWLPLGDTWRECNVERQLEDDDSMLALYRRLLELRRQQPALRRGRFTLVPSGDEEVLAYELSLSRDRLCVALNFSAEPRPLSLPVNAEAVLLSTHAGRPTGADGGMLLRGNEGVVLKLGNEDAA